MPVPPEWTLSSTKIIANLWSGYGSISRQTYTSPSTTTPTNHTTILKRVSAPPSTRYSESHMRKMLSYSIERNFYTHLAPSLNGSKSCHLAHVYDVHDDSIEMEDLSLHYPVEKGMLSLNETRVVIKALAEFHATFWNTQYPAIPPPSPTSKDDVKGIWEEGSYWYLRTRSTELASMSQEWQETARVVDEKIRAIPNEYRTIIHGDLKCANIMFSSSLRHCAFYDLQYAGFGPGVRDLSKFFISSVRGLNEEMEQTLIQFYHDELMNALSTRGIDSKGYTLQVCRQHYDLCFVDFWRFMLGWGAWGNVQFAEAKVDSILQKWSTTK